MNDKSPDLELTILMPCLNEEKSLPFCIDMAQRFLEDNKISGEVLVADNGSTDRSADIAREHGARVVEIKNRGNGYALMGGINAAKGRYIIMADADGSYDFYNLSGFLDALRNGADLVNGNRFKGGIERGAMPFLHEYLGNPVLSWVGRVLFNSHLGDFHCGLKGLKRDSMLKLNLCTKQMNFCTELIVKSLYDGYHLVEVPTTLKPDLRDRPPHLKTWRDGIKNLVFMLSMAKISRLFLLAAIVLVPFVIVVYLFLFVISVL